MTELEAPAKAGSGEEIHAVAAEVAQRAEARGQAESAAQLRALLALDAAETTVVVVGETKRGKSSLVNALIGADVSPVDWQVATSAYVVLRHGSSRTALVETRDGGPQSVPVEELADWATADGSQSELVQAVSVEVESPLLERGLTLIDTPGVGGLSAAHAKVTQAALVNADAVLFVLDPDAPLSGPELGFLERITERIGTVLFVLTKIDMYRGWETIRDANAELLGRRVPRFADAPILPVSSKLKADADAAIADGDPEFARELLAESGFDALESTLESKVIGRAEELRTANVVALSEAVIGRLRLLDRIKETPDDPELERQLVRARERLQELAKAKSEWATNLQSDFEVLRELLDEEYDARLLELRQRYEAEIAAWEEGFLERFPQELQDAVDGLAADLETLFRERVSDILERLAANLQLEAADLAHAGEGRGARDVVLPGHHPVPGSPGAEAGRARLIQTLALTTLAGARFGAAAGPIGLVLGTAGAIVAGLLLNKVTSRFINKGMQRAEGQRQATKALQTAIEMARVELRNPMLRRVASLRRELVQEIRRHIEQRGAELQEEIRRHEREKLQDRAERDRVAREATRRLQELRALENRLHAAAGTS